MQSSVPAAPTEQVETAAEGLGTDGALAGEGRQLGVTPSQLSSLVMGERLPMAEWGRWWLYSWTHAGRAASRADSEL